MESGAMHGDTMQRTRLHHSYSVNGRTAKHLLISKHKGFRFQQVHRAYFMTKPNGSLHEELE